MGILGILMWVWVEERGNGRKEEERWNRECDVREDKEPADDAPGEIPQESPKTGKGVEVAGEGDGDGKVEEPVDRGH